jgi:AcrR family transcriptional regulator
MSGLGIDCLKAYGILPARCRGDSGGGVQFRILGPLEVRDGGRLIELLWGGHPPLSAKAALQNYVVQLRRLLRPAASRTGTAVLVTQPPGYLLRAGPDELDLLRFEHLVADGRRARVAGDVEGAASLLRSALALWQGPPLADVGAEALQHGEATTDHKQPAKPSARRGLRRVVPVAVWPQRTYHEAMLSKRLINESSPGPTGRRAKAQWRRERLLDAALATFVDRGIDGATVKDITAAAGVTQGLLYHYFDDKDALVQAILAERGFLPELRRLLADPPGRPATEVLPALAAGFRRLLAEHAELVTLFFAAARANPAVRADLQAFVAEGQQLLANYLAARVAAGELRPHDTRTAAQLLLSTVALGQVTGTDTDPAAVVEVLLHGLTAPEKSGRFQGGR